MLIKATNRLKTLISYLLVIPFLSYIGMNSIIYSMEQSAINAQNGVLPPVDSTWLHRCMLSTLEAHTGESISLKRLAFARIIKNLLTTKGSLADLDTLALPEDTARYCRKELNRIFAVEWLRSCGKLYTPHSQELCRPFTMMSVDRSYFFEYDDTSTIVYTMDDIYPVKTLDIEGKLLAVSLDSKYLLLKRQQGLVFYDLQQERICCTYNGPYEANKDFLLFDPATAHCSPLSCITYNTVPWNAFRNHYRLSSQHLNELLKHKNAYIFTIEGHGLPTQCLSYGRYIAEFEAVVLPKRYWFSQKHGTAALHTTPVWHDDLLDTNIWQEEKGNILHIGSRIIPVEVKNIADIYCFDLSHDMHHLVLGGYEGFLISCDLSETAARIDLRDPHHTYLKPYAKEKDTHWEADNTSFLHLAASPDGRYLLSVGNWMEYEFGYEESATNCDGSATIRLHALASHDLQAPHNYNCVKIYENTFIPHFGFSNDGSKFFICTKTHFQIFDMASFAPILPYTQLQQILSLIHYFEYTYLQCKDERIKDVCLERIASLDDPHLKITLTSFLKLSDTQYPALYK